MNSVKLFGRAVVSPMALAALALLLLPAALVLSAQQANSCTNAPIAADPSPTVCISRVTVPFNGTSPDNQFYVSWRSQKAETGQVKLSDGQIFQDVRGADYEGRTHYVLVNNLTARRTYQFDILSGGATFTNGGAHWSQRTGPAIQTGTPYVIVGRVKNPDGSDADGAIVYAQVRDADDQGTQGRSALLSGLIVLADGGNFFNIDLDQARSANNNQKFIWNPDTDRVQITAVGVQGTVSKTFRISDLHPPAPNVTLTLGDSGTGAVATATPTEIPPTATPTFSPTATPTETPISPTATPTAVPPTETIESIPTEMAEAKATLEGAEPTLVPEEETRIAELPEETFVAVPAGEEVEPPRTRVLRGVPDLVPPAQTSGNSMLWIVALAVVLFVGALLLGLAAFFISRR